MNILIIIGLGLNLLGTIILVFPVLSIKELLDDTKIMKSGENKEGESWVITEGRKKIRKISLLGLGLISLGFAIQIISFI